MANWVGSARTNYFDVKDVVEFMAALEPFEVEVHVSDEGGLLCLLARGENGDFPTSRFDEESEDYVDVDLPALVAEHLTDDSIAVFQEVGAEKLRYLTGWAVAVNAAGDRVEVNIDDVYAKAEQVFSGKITQAAY
jgi:hypothetical protein